MKKFINIIDLFAGPGGLGEGFSNWPDGSPFSIAMSVEKEKSAHDTLTLRAFFRKFTYGSAPEEYYDYIRTTETKKKHEAKYALKEKYASEWMAAEEETLGSPRALGDKENHEWIFERFRKFKKENKGPCIVIGGPPCQAYSLAGRSRNKGNSSYRPEKDERHFLYKEYMKVLDLIEPEIFVMENVKGILSSSISGKSLFPKIIEDLKKPCVVNGRKNGPSYKIHSLVNDPLKLDIFDGPSYTSHTDFIISSENYGIPQTRHRVILLGIREDIGRYPSCLKKTSSIISVKDMICGMPAIRSGLSTLEDTDTNWYRLMNQIYKKFRKRLQGDTFQQFHGFLEKLMRDNSMEYLSKGSAFVKSRSNGFSQSFPKRKTSTSLFEWIFDKRIGGFANHESRNHIEGDLERYLFCALWASANENRDHYSPKSKDFPAFLAPKHKNWETGHFDDRFRCQTANRPATTITSHISKDGHYFIHYDPRQCRSLTVREAARLQTFPDNYYFEGYKTQQYVQVGNAVPPYLAKQIAKKVYDILK